MDNHPNTSSSSSLVPGDWGTSRSEQISRSTMLRMIQAAIQCGETRFAQRSALQWLASYPGDLAVSLAYAQALLQEDRSPAAAPILRGLCQADPQFLEAIRLLMKVEMAAQSKSAPVNPGAPMDASALRPTRDRAYYANWLAALGAGDEANPGPQSDKSDIVTQNTNQPSDWGMKIWRLHQDLAAGDVTQAETRLPGLLASNPGHPLLALAHLEILRRSADTPLAASRSLAEIYRRQYPDCLALGLIYADVLIQEGSAERGVTLLHQVAARDISGQVVRRLWGDSHPYTSLWPAAMEIHFDLIVPAPVSERMGWNRLPPGNAGNEPAVLALSLADEDLEIPALEEDRSHTLLAGAALLASQGDSQALSSGAEEAAIPAETPASDEGRAGETASKIAAVAAAGMAEQDAATEDTPQPKAVDEEVVSIQKELDQIAANLRQPGLAGTDGRFPIYVVFSVESRLAGRYGPEGARQIVNEMQLLAQAVKSASAIKLGKRWGGRVFLPDSPESAGQFGLKPIAADDPWKQKLALRDLDAALARHGEMIGALLIVGGPEIVPFHNLPNPVDDPDQEIPSDNPFGTRDENYFITEWPVGRIPGGNTHSPQVLLDNLRAVTRNYTTPARPAQPMKRIFAWLTGWLRPSRHGKKSSFGYTAAVWRQASETVYRPIGETRSLLISPPMGVNGSSPNGSYKIPLPTARLGYFNLHGLVDSGEWYGQKDPADSSQEPDFPVALRPQDVRSLQANIPQVVFTEACYGAHIVDKSSENALALQFLQAGCQVVVGSTVMSYGSIRAPLIAADLLGYLFWKGFQEGLPAGEALRRARLQLASEMHTRQGYLDGEDQKTLISFILFGDPLARNPSLGKAAKRIHRTLRPALEVETVCDRQADPVDAQAIPQEVIAHVKNIASTYLPGMNDAHLSYAVERAVCQASGHDCPTHRMKGKAERKASTGRQVVVLSKSFTRADHVHQKIARLTLDENGTLVKMVVSR